MPVAAVGGGVRCAVCSLQVHSTPVTKTALSMLPIKRGVRSLKSFARRTSLKAFALAASSLRSLSFKSQCQSWHSADTDRLVPGECVEDLTLGALGRPLLLAYRALNGESDEHFGHGTLPAK